MNLVDDSRIRIILQLCGVKGKMKLFIVRRWFGTINGSNVLEFAEPVIVIPFSLILHFTENITKQYS